MWDNATFGGNFETQWVRVSSRVRTALAKMLGLHLKFCKFGSSTIAKATNQCFYSSHSSMQEPKCTLLCMAIR